MRKRKWVRLREGAGAHTRAVELFGEHPEKPITRLYSEAVSGKKMPIKQMANIPVALGRLKRNYFWVEKFGRKLSAKDMLSAVFKTLGLKAEPQKHILKCEMGKDAFGFILTVDNQTFRKLSRRVCELDYTIGGARAVSSPITLIDPSTKKRHEVMLSIMPEKVVSHELKKEEAQAHEKAHREDFALGIRTKAGMPIRTKREARKFIIHKLRTEVIAGVRTGRIDRLRLFMIRFFGRSRYLVWDSMSEREITDIRFKMPKLIEKSIGKIPKDELIGIIRTTPLLKLRRRLEGILAHT